MTAAAALIAALEQSKGQTLVMQAGARPHVITDSGAVRDVGSTELAPAMMQTLLSELLDIETRVALDRDHHVSLPLVALTGDTYALTVDYADNRFSLRVQHQREATFS